MRHAVFLLVFLGLPSWAAPALKPPKGSAGKVGGRAKFTATGNSVADMLGTSNGEVALIINTPSGKGALSTL